MQFFFCKNIEEIIYNTTKFMSQIDVSFPF
jgi:hypothetical protein